MSKTRACLQSLPMELHWNILENVSDVRTLASAALTCWALYSAFKAKEADLPTDVLVNTIGYDVLPEAVFVYQCSPPFLTTTNSPAFQHIHALLSGQTAAQHSYARQFIRHIKQRNVPTFIKWGMDEALLLNAFHVDVVVPLTQRFIRSAAQEPMSFPGKDLDESLQDRPATRLEKERIARALYRFELYRKLFGHCTDGVDYQRIDGTLPPHVYCFFKRLAPWEIVQLATIHDFLANQLIPAMGDVAEHDIEWAASVIDKKHISLWNRRIGHHAVQYQLTLGLEEILKIASCDTFKNRMRALSDGATLRVVRQSFLALAFRVSDALGPTPTGLRLLYGKPYHDDGDAGAQQMWRAGLDDNRSPFYDARDWLDRRWGSVMWDRERFQELGVLDKPWSRAEEAEQGIPPADFKRSLQKRAKLWAMGGRGYWSMHDESRVVYPNGRKEPPTASATDRTKSWVMTVSDDSAPVHNASSDSWYTRLGRKFSGR